MLQHNWYQTFLQSGCIWFLTKRACAKPSDSHVQHLSATMFSAKIRSLWKFRVPWNRRRATEDIDIYMIFTLYLYDVYMMFIWCVYIYMIFIWCLYDVYMMCIYWYDIYMVFIWHLYDIYIYIYMCKDIYIYNYIYIYIIHILTGN